MQQPLDRSGLTEEEFLRRYDPDKYPKPSVTADIVVFRRRNGAPEVLLIRRGGHPFLGRWAFPGGFAERGERIEQTAARELQEETGVTDVDMTLVGVYSKPGRDPRGWTMSAAYAAVVDTAEATAMDDAAEVRWAPLERDAQGVYRLRRDDGLTPDERGCILAFDHDEILADAVRMICG